MDVRKPLAILGVAAVLAGCGAHGSFVPSSALMASQQANAPAVTISGSSSAAFTIKVPKSSADFASVYAKSVRVALTSPQKMQYAPINLNAKDRVCTTLSTVLECTIVEKAPASRDHFTVTLYDGPNGKGAALSVARAAATIKPGKPTKVPLTLDGVVASVSIECEYPSPQAAPTSDPLIIQAKDASGATIVGPAPYDHPIELTDSDTSGATSLSTQAVTSPSSRVMLEYDGSPSLSVATITATAVGVAPSSVTPGSMMPAPAGSTESVGEQVEAGVGTTLTLPSGTQLQIPPNALASSSVVLLSTVPSPKATPPGITWNVASSDVRVSFAIPQHRDVSYARAMAHSSAVLPMSIVLPSTYAPAARRRHDGGNSPLAMAVLNICTPATCVPIAPNPNQQGLAVTLNLSPTYFGGPDPVTLVEAFIVNMKGGTVEQPGLRYWNPSTASWTVVPPYATPPPAVHPILLLHGIMSSVEDTFTPQMVSQLRANGAYDVVLGYDYDWNDNFDNQASQIAGAVDALGYQNLDIMAHSMGTLVAMDLSTQISPTVQNLILVEGPLHGAMTSQADFLLTTMLYAVSPNPETVVSSLGVGAAGLLFLTAPWAEQFAPNDPQVASVEAAMNASPPERLIKIAGNTPYPGEAAAYSLITGTQMPTLNDGVMTTNSELAPDLLGQTTSVVYGTPPLTFATPFPATHTGIIGDASDELEYQVQIEDQIGFEFSNADPVTGLYDNGTTPTVFMKSTNSWTYFCAFGLGNDTYAYTGLSTNFSPDQLGPIDEAWDQFGCTQASPQQVPPASPPATPDVPGTGFTYYLENLPAQAIGITPTAPLVFAETDMTTNQTTNNFAALDIWALPACTSGPPKSGCAEISESVAIEAQTTRSIEVLKSRFFARHSGHGKVRTLPWPRMHRHHRRPLARWPRPRSHRLI